MRFGTLKALSARRSLSLFLAGTVCLAVWQIWLTWRLMEQDRKLELQRSHDRLEQVGDLAVAQLARSLGEWELAVRERNSPLPPSPTQQAKFPVDSTLIFISRGPVAVFPPRPLLFVPGPAVAQVESSRVYAAADEFELREQQYDSALAALQPLVNEPSTRPEALLRIARIERKAGRAQAALDAYKRLESEAALNTSGTPYALLAGNARCRIMEELGRQKDATAEAELLRAELLQGRWPINREVFEYHWAELDRLSVGAGQLPQSSFEFSALVSELYDRWQAAVRAGSNPSGRDLRPDSSLLVWNATPERLSALVTTPDWLSSGFKLPANSRDVHWRVVSPGLPPGAPTESGPSVTRSLADVQLPGRLEFSGPPPSAGMAYRRRSLWLTGVALMLMLVLAAAYGIHRGISQELRVARLQSDFVAAVSHEFRSPLTTLRTITELLAQDRIADEPRRRQSYTFLDRETSRLHRLVEDLLDFGRMESGRKQYRLEAHDAFQLVRAAVTDVSQEAAAGGFQVETTLGSGPATIRADEEAFRRAVRNLLENAMKYSPECRTVWVDGAVNDHKVAISVRDQGMGIDPREQREIFQKFVRGNAAKKAGIKGTGIGLSMVHQIIEALGGEIRLQSKAGAGSTFTIVLPLVEG